MRIVYIGSVYFSYCMLEHLFKLNFNIVGVVSKQKSNFNSDFYDLSSLCEEYQTPNYITKDINDDETTSWIREKSPDVIYCFGWSNILKNKLLNIPKKGVIGFHPTLLPLNRGRHPLIWAKVLGLKESGSTFFLMDEGADTGPIISQKKFKIEFEDTAQDLYNKIIDNGKKQVQLFTNELIKNKEKLILQKSDSNYWRKRTKSDGRICFSASSEKIINLVRALSNPYPGATCFFENEEVIIWSIEKGANKESNLEPGKVLSVNQNRIEVKTGNGSVILTDHEFSTIPEVNQYLM